MLLEADDATIKESCQRVATTLVEENGREVRELTGGKIVSYSSRLNGWELVILGRLSKIYFCTKQPSLLGRV